MRRVVGIALTVILTALSAATPAWALTLATPLDSPVVRGFDPPSVAWGSGHRGVDLAATPGEPVHAAASGRVTFAGLVAGKPVIVISHGDLRTTYEPVTATVSVGTSVAAGDVIGSVQAGHACPGGWCLHWGLKRGDTYLDPLGLAGDEVRLLPETAIGVAKAAAAARRVGEGGTGQFFRPVPGGIGSPFGLRRHPIFHDLRLHAGVDLHASCGTPIHAALDGVVIHRGFDASGGNRLVIQHAGGLTTHYLHAQGYRVRVGQHVRRGQVVGSVGSTGWSTACHLHFTVKLNGRLVDPARYL